ncbi:dual specificity protein phosphatase 22 isoform X12 [Equus asinus]|uniref:dual specificity protein phosphatase 22 isoform X12 n=1 Tax=Equus asinus TaxID=9793 RepID=UPI0038F6F70C
MGNGMNKILPGLYIGNFKDARDAEQLSKNKVTHILSVHDSARPMLEGVKYLCIPAADSPSQNLLAGVSRSVTLVIAYIMTVTDFGWEDALHTVRAGRSCANPNLGFQRQLQDFEKHEVHQYRQWLKEEYGESPLRDAEEARNILGMFFLHSHPGNSEAPGLSQTTVICLKFLKCCKATELRLVLPKRNST